MKCPSRLVVGGCVAAILAMVVANVESAKRDHATAIASDANLMAAGAASVQTGIELDPRIRKVGDLPEVLTSEYFACQLQFINEQEGWLAVLVESKIGTDSGRLWRTRDGGNTWELIYSNPANRIAQFQFINSKTGWMSIEGQMFKTTDGGNSWQPFHQPIPHDFAGQVFAFKFLDDGKHGWVAGGIYKPFAGNDQEDGYAPTRYTSIDMKKGLHGAIFQTTDGGQSWRQRFVSKEYGYIGELFIINEITGTAFGSAGVLYLQKRVWKVAPSHYIGAEDSRVHALDIQIGMPTFEPYTIFQIDELTGWLSNNNGFLAKTEDGGRTWRDLLNANNILNREWPMGFLNNLYFKDAVDGFGRGFQTTA